MTIKVTSKNKKVGVKKVSRVPQKEDSIIESIKDGKLLGDNGNGGYSQKTLVAGIIAVIIVAIIVAVVDIIRRPSRTGSEVVVSRNELKDKLNVDIKDPLGGDDVVYGIENNNIAKLSYKKKVSDGTEMNFILRTSSSTEDIENSIGLDVEFSYTRIMMTVVCEDGSEVSVESRVALDEVSDEMRYMKALWYDNDKYYSMVTDNLVTREDFLQEVNRVIIANHVQF